MELGRFEMSIPSFPEYLPDPDDDTSIDDAFIKAPIDVHIERMHNSYYWLGITTADGKTHHVDITLDRGRRVIRARVRK